MISARNLSVQFGAIRPIDDLTVDLAAPISGLIGPNGAGKTTFLNAISGFVLPVSGEITLDGKRLDRLSPSRRARLGVRRSFQTAQIADELTVGGNVLAAADNFVPVGSRAAAVHRAMDFAGIGPLADRPGAELNLFQRRLLDLAKSVVGAPRLILLDEPAAGLSDSESALLRALIARVPAEWSAQVLLIDHDVELIRLLCEETMVLDFGRLLAKGPTASVLEHADVRRAYLGEL